jgi:hypothetical protein
MAEFSRRSFLSKGTVGAAGVVGVVSAGPNVLAAITTSEPELTNEELAVLDNPMFVHVRDAAAGEVEVMVNESSVVFNDKTLVARLLRGAR